MTRSSASPRSSRAGRRWAGGSARRRSSATLDGAPVRVPGTRDPGRVAVLDLLRARTRRFEAVFVVGLEEGTFPRRSSETPFLPDEQRAALEAASARPPPRSARSARPRPLPLLHRLHASLAAAHARPRGGDGRRAAPRAESVLGRGPLALRSGRGGALDAQAAAVRALLGARPRADRAGAAARGRQRWPRRRRARRARSPRRTAGSGGSSGRSARSRARPGSTHPAVLAELRERLRFSATELETFGECSSMWLVDRVVDPKTIDAEVDPRLRGSVAHAALYRFYSGLPKRLGVDQVEPDRLDEALEFMRECLSEAIAGQVRIELSDVELLELEGALARDLEQFVRQEVELGFPLVPRRFEVAFGIDRAHRSSFSAASTSAASRSPGRSTGSTSTRSARAGSSRTTSPARPRTRRRRSSPRASFRSRSTCSRCATSSGSSRSAGCTGRWPARARRAGSCSPRPRGQEVPGLKRADYLDDDEFWGRVEGAKERARIGRGEDPGGRRGARPAPRRVPVMVRALADVPGAAGVNADRDEGPQPRADQGDRGDWRRLRLGRRGHGQDDGARRAVRPGGVRARALGRLAARHHLHGARGRRAPDADPRPVRRARPPRPRARGRPRLDLDHPRLLLAPAPEPSVRGRARPALSRPRREPGARSRVGGVRRRRSPSSAPAASPTACGSSRRTAPRGSAACSGASSSACARRAGRSCSKEAGRPPRRARRPSSRKPRGSRSPPWGMTRRAAAVERRARAPIAAACARAAPRPERARVSTRPSPSASPATTRRWRRSRSRRSRRWPRATASSSGGAARRLRPRVRSGKGGRVGARLRGSPASRPRPPPRASRGSRARELALPVGAWWTSSRTRTGSSASSSTCSAPRSSSSSATSSSRSTASATPTSRSSASGERRARASSR